MPVTSDTIVFGNLTGSGTQDTIRTATGTEYVVVTFRNHHATLARTLSIWLNAVADANLVLKDASLEAGESIVLEHKMGSGDLIKAEASAATSISAIVEVDALS